jgi:hypothetical protein
MSEVPLYPCTGPLANSDSALWHGAPQPQSLLSVLQEYLANNEAPPPMAIQQDYA